MNANIPNHLRRLCSSLFLTAIISFSVLLPPAATAQEQTLPELVPGQRPTLRSPLPAEALSSAVPGHSLALPYVRGDVFASSGPGIVKVFDQAGNLKQTLNDGIPVYTAAGSAFDADGNFYLTTFNYGLVSKFDNSGNLVNLAFMACDPGASCESIVRDAAGNFYVGQAVGTADILKFDGTTGGAPIARYDAAIGPRGTDWIDLAADQKTIYYTSQGALIRRFDVSTNTQLPDFNATDPGQKLFALRIMPDGGVLVANERNVLRYNSSGNIVQTYSVGSGTLFALSRDPDGTSFWTAEIFSGQIFKVDIASGAILTTFNANTSGQVGGLSIFGERTVAIAGVTVEPPADTNFVGQSHTVTATVIENGQPAPGKHVTFTIVSGPNAGASGTCSPNPGCNTDANGQVSFSYQGTGGGGTDSICATVTDTRGNEHADCVIKFWEPPPCEVDCSEAFASPAILWPPNHKYRAISIEGVTLSGCEGESLLIVPTGVTQDEPVNGLGDGNTCPDAQIVDGQVTVRAERSVYPGVLGNGRVYTIHFTAFVDGDSCPGTVTVCVPHDSSDSTCIDDGQRYSSLGPCTGSHATLPEAISLDVIGVTNNAAELTFALPIDAHVKLAAFDVAGRRLATIEDASLTRGVYNRAWNMAGLSSGMYFVRMTVNGASVTRTVIRAR